MNDPHTKVLLRRRDDTAPNSSSGGSKNRLRYASSRQRSRTATADVYRTGFSSSHPNNKRSRPGVLTSASGREERVHHPDSAFTSSRCNSKKKKAKYSSAAAAAAVVVPTENDDDDAPEEDEEEEILEAGTDTQFASELDTSLDRNASEIFAKFYRDLWPLVRSLPEVLHHADQIVDVLLAYLLSPADAPGEASSARVGNTIANTTITSTSSTNSSSSNKQQQQQPQQRKRFIVNQATTDILHLITVLARDLRHEIHPFLHTKLLPRLLNDLLNPPAIVVVPAASSLFTKKQPAPLPVLDVTLVEAVFRTLSYVFRYDADALLSEVVAVVANGSSKKSSKNSSNNTSQAKPCLEGLRQYYGVTLAHKRDLIRRLAAESFAPVIRKLRSESAQKRHMGRILRALAASAAANVCIAGAGAGAGGGATSAADERLQSDAVDGIAQLLLEVARGAAGRLHSRGGAVVMATVLDALWTPTPTAATATTTTTRSSSSSSSNTKNGQDLIFAVASAFFQRLCHHLKGPHCASVISTVIAVTMEKCREIDNDVSSSSSLQYLLQLVQQVSAHRSGALLRQQQRHDNNTPQLLLDQLEGLLHMLLEKKRFLSLTGTCREAVTNLLFSTLQLVPENTDLCSRIMTDSLRHVLTVPVGGNHDSPNTTAAVTTTTTSTTTRIRNENVACLVVRDLIPHLPVELAMHTIGTAVLSAAAAEIATRDPAMTLTLVHAMATVKGQRNSDDNDDDSDDIFFIAHAAACNLSDDETETLLNVCLVNRVETTAQLTTKENCAKLAACGKAACFLAAVGGDTVDNKRSGINYKRVSKWLLELMQRINDDGDKETTAPELALVLSMSIESLSCLSSLALGYLKDTSPVASALKKARPIVLKHLLSKSSHLWALKGASSFVAALRSVDLFLSDDPDAVFESLIPNLRDQNHFCRLHALQILASFPKRPFVVDHADLDLTGDLDDEESGHSIIAKDAQQSGVGVTGLCSIIDTLVSIESTPATLKMERKLLSMISRTGVLGRTGKLPVVYAEAAAAHLLGLFNIKFAPIWPVAVKALVGLTNGHEACVWPGLHDQIADLIQKYPYRQQSDEHDDKDAKLVQPVDPTDFYSLCAAWECSRGKDASLFAGDIANAEELGRLSRHHCTDEASVFDSLWSVVEGAPQLVAAHSRTIVPIFLRFMHHQYYVVHADDPDARELGLALLLSDIDGGTQPDPDQSLNGRLVQQRLKCMLKAFASVNGPHQLFKHKYLFSIFVSLLGSQDTQASQLAFSCILKFKLPYVQPYSDVLKSLYEKGKLRDAMMQLNCSAESGTLIPEHRKDLIPVLSRILFGRLSARAGGAQSSKDSPSARRRAVLSFLSAFCVSDDELYPFLYLMMRVYVPASISVMAVELQDSATRSLILGSLAALTPEEFCDLPPQVHQGFLNVLEAVISQLGQKVVSFIPTFTSIIVSLCKAFEVKDVDSMDRDCPVEDQDEEESSARGQADRGGSIRSLCYRRLADVFAHFAETIDFAPYSGSLWGSLKQSLLLLPVMVVNSDKVPSLLLLLQTISGEKTLVKVLKDDDNIVPSVLKCLSDSSKPAVIEATLAFIDNLLDDDDGGPSCGRQLLQRHVGLMLDQFRLRLGCASITQTRGSNFTPKSAVPGSSTWRRELTILCRVSELLDERQHGSSVIEDDAMGSLCLLLIPFLDQQRGIPDPDKQKVLNILEKMITKIPAESAAEHYATLSVLLGPFKARAGFSSRELRRSLASVLNSIADTSYAVASPATKILLQLCAVNAKRVDDMDYDSVIPAISDLGNANCVSSWSSLCTLDNLTFPSVLLPVAQTCFHLLFDEDGVVSRGAFKALQTLVAVASTHSAQESQDDNGDQKWRKLLEGCVVPLVRSGLSSRSESARRFFILLLKEVAQCNKSSPSPNLYGDLNCVIREDEPDLDFFQNITHVQIHRRARALQRLRKLLAVDPEDPTPVPLSLQSLSNVMLPLATHPIYESKTKLEESFALEGIATVGAIARHLSWSKYSAILWTHLTQFERHPEQEKYLVGLICAIIDGFHFDIASQTTVDGEDQEPSSSNNAVWRALDNRIIPKVEGLLTKEKVEKKGGILRSSVVLALHKLIHKLPTKLFEAKLPRLLTVICDALRSRDSNARDVARTSLAKMVVEMDMAYLADVTRELATSLTEGYKLHVRNATLHTILLEISREYRPPEFFEGNGSSQPKFDETVPALMDLIQQDIFGVAQERRDAQGSQVRYVKEAGGSKSAHSLELIATMIRFRPSAAVGVKHLASSSIHVMVSPMLERLRTPGVPTVVTRRIKECLARIVMGLLRNPSIQTNEVIQFVHATLVPFVSKHEMASVMESMDDGLSSDDDDPMKPIHVSGKKKSIDVGATSNTRGQVVEWRPSTLKSAATTKEARKAKGKEEIEIGRVQDGASAPKLTGSRRNASLNMNVKATVNDPATISAVVFGLQLLSPTLKNASGEVGAESMLDPFVPLLTTCVCLCRDTEVVLLALRCLGWLLKTDLPSLTRCSKSLATKTLELLTSAGKNQELLQATFKMLTLLIAFDRRGRVLEAASVENGENSLANGASLPLEAEQLQVLISFLRESIVTSDQHNPAISLIKAIMSRRYVSAEFYDLMESMLEQSVRSPKASLRDQSGIVFVNYLINYPLSPERIGQHLKQVVLNLSYEYTEGRLSAIGLTTTIMDKLPLPVIEQHCQLFFLPLTLQLVNDESKECREAVAKCIGKLLWKLSTEVLQSLYGYTERWSQGDVPLRRMSLQLFAIFVDVRSDFIKRGDNAKKLLEKTQLLVKENPDEWEIVYFSLILVEKMTKNFNHHVVVSAPLWDAVIQSMANSHAWIKLASVRLLTGHLHSLDPDNFEASKTFLFDSPGALFQMARNFCFQLGADEEEQSDDLTTIVVKALTWTIQAMTQHPELCFEAGDEAMDRDPVQWVMTRLSNIARAKGTKRRQAVFKCFAAFATFRGAIVFPHLKLMLEPLHRVESETRNELELPSLLSKIRPVNDAVSEEAQLAKDVLHLLEETCEPQEVFLKAYAEVKTRARDKKEQRKADAKIEAVVDPQNAAKHRIEKQDREKKRRKRRVDDRRNGRGATAKRQHF